MHPDETVRPPYLRGQDLGIQAGGVAGQKDVLAAEFVQPVEQLFFQGDVFADRLDDQPETLSPADLL